MTLSGDVQRESIKMVKTIL